jgi:hypothetical protein
VYVFADGRNAWVLELKKHARPLGKTCRELTSSTEAGKGFRPSPRGESNVIDNAIDCLSCEASNSDRSKCLDPEEVPDDLDSDGSRPSQVFAIRGDQPCKFLVLLRPGNGGTRFHHVVAIEQVDLWIELERVRAL